MCGIFGFISNADSKFDLRRFKALSESMFLLSETRGKDASGILFLNASTMSIMKRPLKARKLLCIPEYGHIVKNFETRGNGETLGFLGHTRMVTNGGEERHENNQPILRHGMGLLHNGIIVNEAKLWSQCQDMKREYEVDTEVVLSLVQHYRNEGQTYPEAFGNAFARLQGANSFAFVASDSDCIILATSNGSLYFATSGQELVFASERFILAQTLAHSSINGLFRESEITQIWPGEGSLFHFDNLVPQRFLSSGEIVPISTIELLRHPPRDIQDLRFADEAKARLTFPINIQYLHENESFINHVNDAVRSLKRCAKCILPETFPLIEFDTNGVCNYCRDYVPLRFCGHELLDTIIKPYRRQDGRSDCLVPISGGRDSCYGLHYVKNVLKMNPVAYTYDWGMVTDLARRNISRMCGALGVEHILVSADIKTKRKYIRQNVSAWLKRPTLGTVPLFMAGDKQFFYYAQMLKKQMGIGLAIFSFNRLERTNFKTAFAHIDESRKQVNIHEITTLNKLRLAAYYGLEYIKNPAYINSSVIDTIFAFFSFYMIPKLFEPLYDYIHWDEEIVNNTLIQGYDWEVAKDIKSTWRIGDGTASFYNYIYYVIAGFSENDTFRSNQIREGMISREEAIQAVERDNQPRYESIQWYCDVIEINMEKTLKVINATSKLY